MNITQLSPFEYVSILISIILGLGIAQLLSAFADLLYDIKRVKFYWPHTLWIVFVLFLHVQDWFITYKLSTYTEFNLPILLFILLYPISLFMCAKVLLPTNRTEESFNMKVYYFSQFRLIYLLIGFSILLSIGFNALLLKISWWEQSALIVFLAIMAFMVLKNVHTEWMHKLLILLVCISMFVAVVIEFDSWVIR
ncbi:MAG: hypothetical protein EAY81_10200 [Bacteroidetes bacterium]|nr:MAG: hypothetical protein EAY81_10200 [Bacteroidota bacterium]